MVREAIISWICSPSIRLIRSRQSHGGSRERIYWLPKAGLTTKAESIGGDGVTLDETAA